MTFFDVCSHRGLKQPHFSHFLELLCSLLCTKQSLKYCLCVQNYFLSTHMLYIQRYIDTHRVNRCKALRRLIVLFDMLRNP